jgi:hypothetical protein
MDYESEVGDYQEPLSGKADIHQMFCQILRQPAQFGTRLKFGESKPPFKTSS